MKSTHTNKQRKNGKAIAGQSTGSNIRTSTRIRTKQSRIQEEEEVDIETELKNRDKNKTIEEINQRRVDTVRRIAYLRGGSVMDIWGCDPKTMSERERQIYWRALQMDTHPDKHTNSGAEFLELASSASQSK